MLEEMQRAEALEDLDEDDSEGEDSDVSVMSRLLGYF